MSILNLRRVIRHSQLLRSEMDLYETYVRTAEGDTYHPKDIREGIQQFLSEDGYRISFNIEGVVISLRRDLQVGPEQRFLDEHLDSESVDAAVTIRGHK